MRKMITQNTEVNTTLAESGAQAAFQPHSWTGSPITMASLIESLCTYARCMPTAGRAQWAMAEAAKALAAQSQGAQALPPFSVSRYSDTKERGVLVIFDRKITDDELASVRAALAAQQAAAPGALADLLPPLGIHNDRDMLNYLMVAFDNEIGTCERCGHSEPTKHMDSAGFLRDYLTAAPSAPGTPEAPQTAAARDVLAERQRQVEVEGWTPAHDDQYDGDELSLAAACYALAGDGGKFFPAPDYWPWDPDWWKPTTDRQNLIKAGALVLAEIERLDRAAQLDGGQGEGEKA